MSFLVLLNSLGLKINHFYTFLVLGRAFYVVGRNRKPHFIYFKDIVRLIISKHL